MTQIYEVTVDENGTFWHQNGKLHRLDGPAIELIDGTKYWFVNGENHRDDGPAIVYVDGTKKRSTYSNKWYQNGKLHRLDGPAVEYANGNKYWYIDNVEYTEAEFLAKTAPAKELTVEEVSKLLGYNVKIVKG